jgi:hypothetical protein
VIRRRLGVLLLALPVLLFGCRSAQGPAEYLYREADVDTVTVECVGVGPLVVQAIITGTVSEDCVEIDEVRQEFDEATLSFVLSIATRRPVDETCTQQATPFERMVPLSIEKLPDGIYSVVANGVRTTFELDRGTAAAPQ